MLVHPRTVALSAYYDCELAPDEASGIREHLRECESCSFEYRRIATAANTVRHLRSVNAPGSLSVLVRERIDAEERGMVPVLRGLISRTGNPSGFVPSLGLGTLATILLLSLVVLFDMYGDQAARRLSSALIPTTLPEPVLLHAPMSSPRFRYGLVNTLPFADVERGKEGTMLTLASIDQNGTVRALDVLYRTGDEEMLSRTLDAVRFAGFEPARLGDQTVSVNFLYLFTTTEVRPRGRLSTLDEWSRRLRWTSA